MSESAFPFPRRPRRLDEPEVEAEIEEETPDGEEEVAALAPAQATREMARAFRAQAEALGALRDLQSELLQALKRGERSELVVQNTQALNDTFRNLGAIQRELLTRLDKRTPARSALVPMMVLALLVVLLGAVWVLLDAIERNAPAVDPLAQAERERDAWKEGRQEGRAQADREVRMAQEAQEDASSRAGALQAQIDAKNEELEQMARARRVAEGEREELAGRVRSAQQEVLVKNALEEEARSLTASLAVTQEELQRAMRELADKSRENEDLRLRLADYGLDLPPDPRLPAGDLPPPPGVVPAPEPSGPASPEAERAPALPPPPGPTVSAAAGDTPASPPPRRERDLERDPQLLTAVRQRVNDLLSRTARPGGSSWHLTRVDAMTPERLAGVIALHYDANGRLIDGIEARDLRIVHDRNLRRVEMVFRDGDQVMPGARAPLPAEGVSVVVAEGEAARAWGASGLSLVQSR